MSAVRNSMMVVLSCPSDSLKLSLYVRRRQTFLNADITPITDVVLGDRNTNFIFSW